MANQETSLTLTKENAFNNVLAKIETLQKDTGITLPKNYSPQNAINSAWLKLQEVQDKNHRPALEVCTKSSIVESLYNMVLQGLSPAKNQCYFVVYGDKLQLMKSYLGNIAATKRLKGIKDVYAYCIYEDDEFDYEINFKTGLREIKVHKQKLENIDLNKIKGAYAVITRENEPSYIEIMTMQQIKNAWMQGTAYKSGKSTAHINFTDEMAKKTVINRACKLFAMTSDDEEALVEAINSTPEYNDEDNITRTHQEVEEEIKEKANKEVIDIPAEEIKEVKQETMFKNESKEAPF